MKLREEAEPKAPCPHCGRTDWRWSGECRVGDRPEVRCDYCRPLRMEAYYYGFQATGVEAIDRILSAVAHAGKAYHHTEGWKEPTEDWGPFRGGDYVAWIQNAANDAASQGAQQRTEEQHVALQLIAAHAHNVAAAVFPSDEEERRDRFAEVLKTFGASQKEREPDLDLGLSLDMLDADRLRKWADNIDALGPNITEWGDKVFVYTMMRQIADHIDTAVRDIGILRKQAARLQPLRELAEDVRAEHTGCRLATWGDNRCNQCFRIDALLTDHPEAR